MKKIIMLLLTITVILFLSCSGDDIKKVQNIPTLVKEGFISANEYEIVCIGFPKEGLTGTQKDESAKRAAILNAYFYTGARFNNTVAPDKDGIVKKMEITDTHATVYYVISKSNLKSRLKK
jgi:hypothetical protein